MNWREKVERLTRAHGLRRQLAREVGIARASLYRYLEGAPARGEDELVARIAHALSRMLSRSIPVGWLEDDRAGFPVPEGRGDGLPPAHRRLLAAMRDPTLERAVLTVLEAYEKARRRR